MSALTAERAAIQGLQLPAAYEKLGWRCFRARDFPGHFAATYEELESLENDLARSRNITASAKTPTTLSEKARRVAAQGARFATAHALSLQQTALVRDLGKRAFDILAAEAATVQQYAEALTVLHLRDRITQIDVLLKSYKRPTTKSATSPRASGAWVVLAIGSLLASTAIGWVALRPRQTRPASAPFSQARVSLKRDTNQVPRTGKKPELTPAASVVTPPAAAQTSSQPLTADPDARSISSAQGPKASKGSISHAQFESLEPGMLKFEVEDMLGPPSYRHTNLSQEEMTSNGKSFGYDFTTGIVFLYQVVGTRGGLATIIFSGDGTNPPLVHKRLEEGVVLGKAKESPQNDARVPNMLKTSHISVSEAQSLVREYKNGVIELNSVKSITREVAEILSTHTWVQLNALTELTPEVAQCFVRNGTADEGFELSFNGLRTLTPEVASLLSQTGRKKLSLRGVRSLSASAAAALAASNSALDLSGLSELPAGVATELAKHRGDLILDGVKTLTADAARAIARHGLTGTSQFSYSRNYRLGLRGLVRETMTQEAWEALTITKDKLDLD